MFKYVSIDIETTGLDPEKHQILEFAAVYDDLGDPKPFGELHNFVVKICWNDYVINKYNLASTLLKEIEAERGKVDNVIYIDRLVGLFRNWLTSFGYHDYNIKYNVAGKNFGGFDAQFLKRVPGFPEWNYRILDVGSMYITKDMDMLPNLANCCCRSLIKHRALDDALDVVRAVRAKLL